MPERQYAWADGAILLDHSKAKHRVLRRYLSQYLSIRCSVPQQTRFRLAIIDGFSGGGAYMGGEPGSPIIFLETLRDQSREINVRRAVDGMAQIQFECFLIFNDLDPVAIELLKSNLAPLVDECSAERNLSIKILFLNQEFKVAYLEVKKQLAAERIHRNVFFNLDPCGHSHVPRRIIQDILNSYQSSEVLLTLAIESMLTYLSQNDPAGVAATLNPHGVELKQIQEIPNVAKKREWRAALEQLVFDSYRRCAPYVSPFAINNPEGWLYWLMHFANEPKARQVYNDLLHEIDGTQAHHGRFGLNMLKYDPRNEGQDYLFAAEDRQRASEQLLGDIPRAVSEFGDTVSVAEFLRSVANETPAHSMDIAQAMITSPDLTILTENGGERRSPKGIKPSDQMVLNPQRSFFFMPPIKK